MGKLITRLKRERSVYMTQTMEAVRDTETAIQVFVARALYYRHNNGYGHQIYAALKHLGLGDYIPANGTSYQVKTDKLRDMLPETIEVTLNRAYTPNTSSNTANIITNLAVQWTAALTEDDWTLAAQSDRAVDFAAVTGRFGFRRDLPPVEGDDGTVKAINDTWRDLVTRTLHWGDNNDGFGQLCDELETVLRHLGFGAFLPPQYVSATVTWNGITVQLDNVRAGRDGRPHGDAVRQVLADRAYRARDEDFVVVLTAPEATSADDDEDDEEDD